MLSLPGGDFGHGCSANLSSWFQGTDQCYCGYFIKRIIGSVLSDAAALTRPLLWSLSGYLARLVPDTSSSDNSLFVTGDFQSRHC